MGLQQQFESHQANLLRIVLSWDYFRLQEEQETRETSWYEQDQKTAEADAAEGAAEVEAPKARVSSQGGAGAAEEALPYKSVPTTFASAEEYVSVFEPLLLEELQAQVLRGDGQDEGPRADAAIVTACDSANEFVYVMLALEQEAVQRYHENDLVLVSQEDPLSDEHIPTVHALASVDAHANRQNLRLRLCLQPPPPPDGDAAAAGGRTGAAERVGRVAAGMQEVASAWWVVKLCSISTISREYAALKSVPHLPFLSLLLSCKPTRAVESPWLIPDALQDRLQAGHNESQVKALEACLTREPVILVQGPPGTGKTQTILGLLSVVLHSTPVRSRSNRQSNRDPAHVHPSRPALTPEEKTKNWQVAAPWLMGLPNLRDQVTEDDAPEDFRQNWGLAISLAKPKPTPRGGRVHVLICAPSNAAIDEIALRIMKTGLLDADGELYKPSVVRVGPSSHHSVKGITMDYLLQQRLNSITRSGGPSGGAKSSGAEYDRLRTTILEQASIVCSTLGFSGSSMFARMKRGFDVVIVDEAAQAVEPSTIIPLALGCRQVFLVGDPIQLPATVLSRTATRFGYDTSLFQRLQTADYPVHMLTVQYRMHPQIREFPSREFYNGSLRDGEGVEKGTRRGWHALRCFGPFAFFDVPGREEQPGGTGSYVNVQEAEFVVQLYRQLASRYPELKANATVAVISPYMQQVKLLREKFKTVLKDSPEVLARVDVNTVDGFQGRERDVAIFSCVRSGRNRSIGFVRDFRRMNVGLTRARSSMLVVGCVAALKQDEHWRSLIGHARKSFRLFKVTRPLNRFFEEERLMPMLAEMDAQEEEALKKQAEGGEAPQEEEMEGDEEDDEYGEAPEDGDLLQDGAGYEDAGDRLGETMDIEDEGS